MTEEGKAEVLDFVVAVFAVAVSQFFRSFRSCLVKDAEHIHKLIISFLLRCPFTNIVNIKMTPTYIRKWFTWRWLNKHCASLAEEIGPFIYIRIIQLI